MAAANGCFRVSSYGQRLPFRPTTVFEIPELPHPTAEAVALLAPRVQA